MGKAEFEEKQYEVAFLQELAGGAGPFGLVFSSGQVLEKIVGYDAAAAPDASNIVWRLLKVPRPAGVRLTPTHWPTGARPSAAQLPTTPVSLILQFKRPERLRTANALQWSFWHRPYFRFAVRQRQQTVLSRLERRLGRQALVRYAAPAFATFADLEAAQFARTTVATSGFVKPAALVRHHVWTYREPGTTGRANPRARPRVFESVTDLIRSLSVFDAQPSSLVVSDPLGDHVRGVAALMSRDQPAIRRAVATWRRNVSLADLGLAASTLDNVASVATITTALAAIDAVWLVIGRPLVFSDPAT